MRTECSDSVKCLPNREFCKSWSPTVLQCLILVTVSITPVEPGDDDSASVHVILNVRIVEKIEGNFEKYCVI